MNTHQKSSRNGQQTSSAVHRILALFLTFTVLLPTITPYNNLWANNNGPNAPEASGFEPVTATDMVNLSSGDLAYVLPLFEMEGFPVTLNYHAGVPMEMESSWVGLGWNINTGAITRGVSANPDDWYQGKKANFTLLEFSTEAFTVNVGVGVPKVGEVGIGLSWGSNKSLSGSVNASVGPVSASISTDGSYSVGVGINLSKDGSSYGGGVSASISGKVGEKGITPSVGVGVGTKTTRASLGVSESGVNFSVGGGNTDKASLGGGVSMNSFSSGDYSMSSSGFYIPISIGILSFGFGYNKTDIKLATANTKNAFGSLYHNSALLYKDAESVGGKETNPDNKFIDYQNRGYFGDVFEQQLPQGEVEFIGDTRDAIRKLNFTYAGYDSYEVNAPGIAGQLKPLIGKTSLLIGEGFDGSSLTGGKKMSRVYYHNADINTALKPSNSISNSNLFFGFDGQVTENVNIGGSLSVSSTGNNISNFVTTSGAKSSRTKAGSYVEVFTNRQIATDLTTKAKGLSIPTNLLGKNRSSLGYTNEGIGAYKITTPEGKTFHYAQPVYQYEEISLNYLKPDGIDKNPHNSSSTRQVTPYATHWLLTAITGPDYVDDGNGYPDEEDYGYWIRLDHDRWSNAYSWRSPFSDLRFDNSNAPKNYSTYFDDEVEKSDPGSFQQGRKDIYYLNKIVSKNQIAYFVKDIRKDAKGSTADFVFDATKLANDDTQNLNISLDENITYNTESQLFLDKIVITRNNASVQKVAASASSPSDVNWKAFTETGAYAQGGYIANNLPPASKTHYLHQNQNVIDVNDFSAFDYNNATKVIKLNYDYSLAHNTPSSYAAPDRGRLTLNSVQNFGGGTNKNGASSEANLYDYMPPYEFNYYAPFVEYSRDEPDPITGKFTRANKDNWGFRGDNPAAWSLATIKNPLGAKIKIEYQEDDFYTEAFTRRYWDKNLAFKITDNTPDYLYIEVTKKPGLAFDSFSFADYFKNGEELNYRLWISIAHRGNDSCKCSYSDWGALKIQPDDLRLYDATISEVTADRIIIKQKQNKQYTKTTIRYSYKGYKGTSISEVFQKLQENGEEITSTTYDEIIDSSTVTNEVIDNHADFINQSNDSCYSNGINDLVGVLWYDNKDSNWEYQEVLFGEIPSVPSGSCTQRHKGFGIDYRLLANKLPPGTSGGGLRVSKLTIEDTYDSYVTKYNYNNPFTGESSGITSFNPIRGEVYVPYQNNLPGPGVMYEYVTMGEYKETPSGGEELIKETRYRYHVLQPTEDIFDPELNLEDEDGEDIFSAEVANKSSNGIEAKELTIHKNLSKIGQMISQEIFNKEDQLLSKTEYNYGSRIGSLKESFVSMKSVFDYDSDEYDNPQLKWRYLSLSSLEKQAKVLTKLTTTTTVGRNEISYSDPDEYLGTFNTSTKTLADGTKIEETKTPAYKAYAGMGSKMVNTTNKNMLVQPLLNVTTVNGATLNATLTTWDNDWSYRDDTGVVSSPTNINYKIWRKKAAFVWKDAIKEDGTYETDVNKDNMYFNFTTNTPTSSKWQLSSETEQYNHFSAPIEIRDINNNHASTISGDDDIKTLAVCNAKLTESFYSGAEYISTDSSSYFDHEIKSTGRTSAQAHTGEYSVTINSGQKAYELAMKSGEHDAGDYRLSVWVNAGKQNNVSINVNGVTKNFNESESVVAGGWVLLNAVIPITSASTVVYLTANTSGVYFDDFRLHPISSSMTSYVYDNKDQLSHILGANNMATKYEYDEAGRLHKTYVEVHDIPTQAGGFKLSKESTYNYKK